MNSTLAEVLDAACALPRAERAEVARELIATLETTSESDKARYAELRAAVDQGIEQLDRGEGIRVPADGIGEYIRGLGQIAADRGARRTA
ncbi:MAG: hypothetical protein BGO26_16635 [Actinobacteria bacterium 69-20]|nr:hypothetical protein [Actinomycetota bacterium]OJV27099.1 MAG: hypothetical protein BGO26_16635 [Actinobacteria bacterium 69-20]